MSELTLEEREKRLQRILADAEIRAQGVWRTGTVVTAHSPEREERNIKKPTQPSIKGVSVKSPDSTWVVTIQLDKDSQTMNGSSRVTLEVPLKNLKMPIGVVAQLQKLSRIRPSETAFIGFDSVAGLPLVSSHSESCSASESLRAARYTMLHWSMDRIFV